MYLECSRFHPNRFAFGGVIPERLNIVKTGRKVFSIFGWSLDSSRIINVLLSIYYAVEWFDWIRHCRMYRRSIEYIWYWRIRMQVTKKTSNSRYFSFQTIFTVESGHAWRAFIPGLHDTTGCKTGCQTGLIPGLTTVLNEQPLFVQHGWQTGCQTGMYNRVERPATVRLTGCRTGL